MVAFPARTILMGPRSIQVGNGLSKSFRFKNGFILKINASPKYISSLDLGILSARNLNPKYAFLKKNIKIYFNLII